MAGYHLAAAEATNHEYNHWHWCCKFLEAEASLGKTALK
jgi:hypothetical protein